MTVSLPLRKLLALGSLGARLAAGAKPPGQR